MGSHDKILELEAKLNSFNPDERKKALQALRKMLSSGKIRTSKEKKILNLHCHTFFSYNAYGFSPSYIGWWAKKTGLFAVGTVEFDVLDGVDEFLKAAWSLNLRAVTGIETRVFVPELADKEINSPGEPGISYHIGIGFISSTPPKKSVEFLTGLRQKAAGRIQEIVRRVNEYFNPLSIDFNKDILPLTPAENATERHVCAAYFIKAEELFSDINGRIKFWSEKLAIPIQDVSGIISNPTELQKLIRSKTMKSGGVGYIIPKPETFPELKEMNDFIIKCGGIPTIAWLNGESAAEADLDRLLALHISHGAAAINIIPDRNWNYPASPKRFAAASADQEIKKRKVFELHRVIEAVKTRDLPIIIGTEMNAPGQRMIDDFSCDALKPYLRDFIDGAAIVFAHTLLQHAGMGYLSDWASMNFANTKEKNAYFAKIGKTCSLQAKSRDRRKCDPKLTPDEVLAICQG